MTKDRHHENLAWIDLETTGTDYANDAIMEIGVMITTRKLEILAGESWVCYPSRNPAVSSVHPKVFEMHSKSGLWQESFESRSTLEEIATAAGTFIIAHKAAGSPACGGSVHFDRGFLKLQAPQLNDIFHYRNLDVSSIRNMAKFFAPAIYEESPYVKREGINKEPEHRTLADIEFSIRELRYFLKSFGVTRKT